MRKHVVVLFSAFTVLTLPVALKAQDEDLCAESVRSPGTTFEKVQLWIQTFDSLAKADGLTKDQIGVLQAASKLGTPWYFRAKSGTAGWSIQVKATSNAILEAAFRILPSDIYAAVWKRFQLAPGASSFTAAIPVCNCSTHGGACTAGGVTGYCDDHTTCATCGGAKFGVCSV